jgi:hypothetical protein
VQCAEPAEPASVTHPVMIVLPIMRIGARTRVERYMTMNCSDQTFHKDLGNTKPLTPATIPSKLQGSRCTAFINAESPLTFW